MGIQYLKAVPSLRVSRKIAFRYLWSRRAEAFITIISITSVVGVALGVLVLTVVMAVMTGFQHELREKIVGANAHITVRTLDGRLGAWRATLEEIRAVPGVASVSPYTYHQALVRTDGGASGVLIRGISEGSPAAEQVAAYLPRPEEIARLFDPPPIENAAGEPVPLPGLVIGRELARSIGAFPGSSVALLSPLVSATPFGLTPRLRRFVVSGLYQSGLVEYESGLAYAKLEEAQQFFQMGDAVSGIEVRVHDIDGAPAVGRAIAAALGGAASGYVVQDWTELNRPLWEAIRLEKRVYFLVLLLIIVMASFSIISTLVMLVLEKRRDIAILRTMGATASTVANIFRIQGAAIGGTGVLLGLAGGWCTCLLLRQYGFPLDQKVFQMTELPVRIEPLNFLSVGAAAFLICFLATFYPAHRASRMEPRDILRYE